jgi:hypothetical protein
MELPSPRVALIKQPSCRVSRSNSLSLTDRPLNMSSERLIHSSNHAKEDPTHSGRRKKDPSKPKTELILKQKFQYEIKHASSAGLVILLKALYKQNLYSARIQLLLKNYLEPLSQDPWKSKLVHFDQFFPSNTSEFQQKHLIVSFTFL